MSVRKKGEGRYEARYYDETGKRRSASYRTKKEADAFLARVSADRQRGDFIDPRDAKRLFRDVSAMWVETRVKRPKTVAGYHSRINTHLLPVFGDRAVGSITTMDVRKWLAGMQRKGLASGTVRNAYLTLRPILDAAVEMGCLRANPCVPIRLADSLAPDPPVEQLYLDAEQVARLAGEMPEPYGVVIDFATRTGMRSGEIAALRMRNVDLLRREVRVVESLSEVGGERHFHPPKNGKARKVVLPASLVRQLREYLNGQPAKTPADFLFTDPTMPGEILRPSNYHFYQRMFRPAVRRAGLDPALRFHDLRHTCAALLIAENAPPKAIQEHLGHSSFKMTMDRYGHLFPAAGEQVREALERAFHFDQVNVITAGPR